MHREFAVVCRLASDPSGRPIKGKCRSNGLLSLSVSPALGEHVSVPRLATAPEFDSGRDPPYKPLHGGRFCV